MRRRASPALHAGGACAISLVSVGYWVRIRTSAVSGAEVEPIRQLFRELKRRNVYRVAAAYLAVTFVGLQAVDLLVPSTTLPPWADEFLIALAVFGFPVALVLAWAFELTPEGVRRTPGAAQEESRTHPLLPLAGLVAAAALAGGAWYLATGGGDGAPADPGGGVADPDRTGREVRDRSIAVLPFDNLSGTAEAEPFVNGIHDDLLTRLANVSDLRVISRTSVLPYRDTDLPLPAIAESLQVAWVLEGGVQQAGDRVQVNAQLIHARRDAHQWAESYRRELTTANLFDVQSELTRKIARSLEAELTAEERQRVAHRPTEDLEAYRLYVQGRRALARRTLASIGRARGLFGEALARDSAYAPAWAALAEARLLDVVYTSSELAAEGASEPSASFDDVMRATLPEVKAPARRALALDPDLADAHTVLGAAHYYEQLVDPGRRTGLAALREFRRAMELEPSSSNARQWSADVYLGLGRPGLARRQASLAVELDPLHAAARQVLAMALLAEGHVEEARRHLVVEHPARAPPLQRGFLLYHEGRWDDLARLARGQLTDRRPGTVPLFQFFLARIAALEGDTAAARSLGSALDGRDARFVSGLIHAVLGEADAAFDTWEQVEHWGQHGEDLRYYFPDVLDPLREDPRYRDLIRKVNREWGLNPDGSLPDSADVSFGQPADG